MQSRFRTQLPQVPAVPQPKAVQRKVMVIDYKQYTDNLQSHLAQMHKDHIYNVQSRLSQGKDFRHRRVSQTPRFISAGDPCANLPPVLTDAVFSKKSGGKLGFENKIPKPKTALLNYNTTFYKQGKPSIPPYATYISGRRNILAEDDRHRIFLPFLGDDFEPADESTYPALEAKIEENQTKFYRLQTIEDEAKLHQKYTETFLLEIGTSITAILRYLLNENSAAAPESLPLAYRPYWMSRSSHLVDGYYQEEDDLEAQDPDKSPYESRPQKKWKDLFEALPDATDEQLAIACVACKVFWEETGFSIFHIVKGFTPATKIIHDKFSLGTYTDLVCMTCKA